MTFSSEACERIREIYEAIRTMPFNRELAAGTLSEERFRHYILQDAHYLVGFGRALALAAAKAPTPDRLIQFARGAEVAVQVERSLHETFFTRFGVTREAFQGTPVSPACHHYLSFLLATAYGEPYEVVLAALLPCFWIYAEVGRDAQAGLSGDNPYRAWIETYSGDEFHRAVEAIRQATDEAAENAGPGTRARMIEVFTRAAQLEWCFWDAAYRLEEWPFPAAVSLTFDTKGAR